MNTIHMLDIIAPTTPEAAARQLEILRESELADITTPEWLAITTTGLPEDNPVLANEIKEIRHRVLFECIRTHRSNSRYLALHGLKKTLDSLHEQ